MSLWRKRLSIKSDDLSIKQSKGIEMSIEAMKQWLEALKDVGNLTTREWQAVHKNKANELRQAIAEAEKQEQGEPVAEVTSETGAEITMSWWHEPALPIGTKLYTTPQQRTWVGLTDKEMNLIYAEPQTHIGQYARAIEAKLKEKNT